MEDLLKYLVGYVSKSIVHSLKSMKVTDTIGVKTAYMIIKILIWDQDKLHYTPLQRARQG